MVFSLSATPPAQAEEAGEKTSPDKISKELPPEDEGRSLYNRGVELFQIGQIQAEKGNKRGQKKLLEESIRQFEAALDKNPALVEAQSNIGFAYLTLEDHKRAIKAFNQALEINDKHLNSLNGLSTAYAFNGKIKQAIETFDRLTHLDPGNPQYFFNKGSVLQKAGQIEEAQEAYREALNIQPKYQRALFNLGTLLENQGQLKAALPYYEKAKGTNIGNPVGLEAIRRIEAIQAVLKARADSSQNTSKKSGTEKALPAKGLKD